MRLELLITQAEEHLEVDSPKIDRKTHAEIAESLCSQVIKLDERNALAHLYRAVAKSKKALHFDANSNVPYLEAESAIQDFERAREIDANFKIRQPHAKAIATQYHSRGFYRGLVDVERAIQDFDRAIELDPSLAVAYYHRAQVRVLLGQMNDALKDLNKAIKLDSTYAGAYYLRGHIYHGLNDTIKAQKDFESALAVRDDLPHAHHELGLIHKNKRNLKKAAEHYRRAFELSCEKMMYGDLFHSIVQTFYTLTRTLGSDNLSRLKRYERCEEKNVDEGDVYYELSNWHSVLFGKFKQEQAEYEQVYAAYLASPHFQWH